MLACLSQAQEGIGLIKAWQNSSAKLSDSGKAYRMTGQAVAYQGNSGTQVLRKLHWTSLWQDSKYKVEWQVESQAKHLQSYDGNLWYGLTSDENGGDGIICENPQESVDADLDANLRSKVAGLFYLSINDFFQRPINVGGGLNLIEQYLELPSGLEAKVDKQSLVLTLPVNNKDNLPSRLRLQAYGDYLMPVECTLGGRDSGPIQTMKVLAVGEVNGIPFPKEIDYNISERRDGSVRTILRTRYVITLKDVPSPQERDFQIEFAESVNLLDDRKDKSTRYRPAISTSSPEAWSKVTVIGVCVGLAAIFVGIILQRFSRRKA